MNFVAISVIIFLCLSHSSSREIPRFPDFTIGRNNRPYIPIPAVDEVWRKPIFGRSPVFYPENDFVEFVDDPSPLPSSDSDSQESNNDIDYGRKNAQEPEVNSNANSEKVQEDDIRKTDQNVVKNNDNDGENKSIDVEEVDENGDGENNNSEEKKDQEENKDDEILNDKKDENGSNKVPYFNLKQMTKYLKELERTLEEMFKQTMAESALLNGTYANTTEEKVEVNGQKFLVQKSVIQTGDNNSSIFIETVDLLPETEAKRTKRSNWNAERAQKAKESDP